MRSSFPVVLALVLVATGCRSTPAPSPQASGAPRDGDIFSVADGRRVTFDQLMDRIRKEKVVYVGEQHNNDFHHAFQLQVVQAMFAQDPRVAVGMEMFQRPYQAPLDAFVRGEIDEETMLRQTEYFSRWGWDYNYYRPILLFARDHGLPVIGLNAPPDARKKLAREGREALTDEEKAWVAENVDETNEAHKAAFERAVGGGNHPAASPMMVMMYRSQCIWEDTMAESAARALAALPGYRMAVLAGGFHTQRFSIPERAAKRGATPFTILNGETTRLSEADLPDVLDPDWADWVYVTRPAPDLAPTPKLGVMLGEPGGGTGLPITGAMPGGIAYLAGAKHGDRIVQVNGYDIRDAEDLKKALAFMTERMGSLTVLRGGSRIELPFDRAWSAP